MIKADRETLTLHKQSKVSQAVCRSFSPKITKAKSRNLTQSGNAAADTNKKKHQFYQHAARSGKEHCANKNTLLSRDRRKMP